MNLTIDIGNTRTKLGFFKEKSLVKKLTWEEWKWKDLKELLHNQKVKNIICSTVRPIDKELNKHLNKHWYFINLDATTPLPIQNLYKTPKTLGKDRLAAVVGAKALFPKQACLVIDAGTCITYDLINEQGDYLGGNITPGLKMRFKAMQHFTAKLPLVKRRVKVKKTIGQNTKEALQIGGGLGNILEMEAWIQLFQSKFEGINTTLTGGDAEYFAKRLKTKIFANPNLVLIGLNKILDYNVE
jgi:type III pantothenate kinase